MNILPLPQGQRSFRPSFSSSSLSPCTICSPALTRVSDGKPLRRLLMTSRLKAVVVVVVEKSVGWTRHTSGEKSNNGQGRRTLSVIDVRWDDTRVAVGVRVPIRLDCGPVTLLTDVSRRSFGSQLDRLLELRICSCRVGQSIFHRYVGLDANPFEPLAVN